MSQPESREQLSARDRRAFVLRKLHSLTGVVPVGIYLVFHLWINAKALQGREAFDDAVLGIAHLPYVVLVEIFVIGLPLLYHAAYGIAITLEARPNVKRYSTGYNWGYLMQRVSGIVTLVFLVYHVWTLRVPVALGTMEKSDFFPTLCNTLSSTHADIPLVALAYLFGTLAAVYHFTFGLYGFCFSWGITLSRRASQVATGVFTIAGIVLFGLAANTIIYYATGSRLVFDIRDENQSAISCRDVLSEPAAGAETATQTPRASFAPHAPERSIEVPGGAPR